MNFDTYKLATAAGNRKALDMIDTVHELCI